MPSSDNEEMQTAETASSNYFGVVEGPISDTLTNLPASTRSVLAKRDRHSHSSSAATASNAPSSPGGVGISPFSYTHRTGSSASVNHHKSVRTPILSSPRHGHDDDDDDEDGEDGNGREDPTSDDEIGARDGARGLGVSGNTPSTHTAFNFESTLLQLKLPGAGIVSGGGPPIKPMPKGLLGGISSRRSSNVPLLNSPGVSSAHTPGVHTPHAAPQGVEASGSFFNMSHQPSKSVGATFFAGHSSSSSTLAAQPPFATSSTMTTAATPTANGPLSSTTSSAMRMSASDAGPSTTLTQPGSTAMPLKLPIGGVRGMPLKLPGGIAGVPNSSLTGKSLSGASTVASGVRRGSLVVNTRFKAVCVPSQEMLDYLMVSPPSTPDASPTIAQYRSQRERESSVASTVSSTSTSTSTSSATDRTNEQRYNTDTLVLDLRPHTSYVAQGRLRGSLNICVPSTLLRRPAFSLAKIAETLPTRRERSRFAKKLNLIDAVSEGDISSYKNAGGAEGELRRAKRVLVLDQESTALTADSAIFFLLSKLERAGFKGDLCWLKGGFATLLKWLYDQSHAARADDAKAMQTSPDGTADMLNAADQIGKDIVDWQPLSEDDIVDDDDADAEDGQETDDSEAFGPDSQSGQQDETMTGNNDATTPHAAPQIDSTGAFPLSIPRSTRAPSRSDSVMTTDSTPEFASVFSSAHSSFAETDSGFASGGSGPRAFDAARLQLPGMKRSASPGNIQGLTGSLDQLQRRGVTEEPSEPRNDKGLSKSSSVPIIRPGKLPLAAFQSGSTAAAAATLELKDTPAAPGQKKSSSPIAQLRQLGASGMSGPSLPMPDKWAGLAKLEPVPSSKVAANPFFDNIRQNIEVRWHPLTLYSLQLLTRMRSLVQAASIDTTLAHVPPMEIAPEFTDPAVMEHLPPFLRHLISLSPVARAKKLHTEYFELERNEQRRLQKVLDWHCEQSQSNASGHTQVLPNSTSDKDHIVDEVADSMSHRAAKSKGDQYHPFSISAGVEKGHLNRYKNMWPVSQSASYDGIFTPANRYFAHCEQYEHARVRLASEESPNTGDYINASHIRLRGTRKRYIAAQGPLEGTTEHFWRLVMEQHVNVIVMLTLLTEGGREKCTNYFRTAKHGSISVKMVDERGDSQAIRRASAEEVGFFGFGEAVATPQQAEKTVPNKSPDTASKLGHKRSRSRRLMDDALVHRVIEVRRDTDPPDTPPHVVQHIQYILWPDFDIPPDPAAVVDVIAETSQAHRDAASSRDDPVLVHCSAGVGRTGSE